MSNALAIAAVTATLRDLLRNGLIDHDVAPSLGDVAVSVVAPDRAQDRLTDDRSELNLFLYRVTPNAGWRNVGLPSRSGSGERLTNPPLALDLHYLVTALSNQDLHAELLLGYAMQVLHETPVLDRAALRRALGAPAPVTGATLPVDLREVAAAELADQVELIKLTPQTLSLEEIGQLWSNLGGRSRPCAAYEASVVLIEARRPRRSAPPVQAVAVTATTARRPVIETVASQAALADEPSTTRPITVGDRLVLLGQRLRAEDATVSIDGAGVDPAAAHWRDDRVSVALPAGLAAGVHTALVVHDEQLGMPPVRRRGASSNVVPFLLRPTVEVAGPAVRAEDEVELTLTVDPPLGRSQRAMVTLDGAGGESLGFALPSRGDPDAPPQSTVVVRIGPLSPGSYVVRLQVDGADSPPADGPAQRVVVP